MDGKGLCSERILGKLQDFTLQRSEDGAQLAPKSAEGSGFHNSRLKSRGLKDLEWELDSRDVGVKLFALMKELY